TNATRARWLQGQQMVHGAVLFVGHARQLVAAIDPPTAREISLSSSDASVSLLSCSLAEGFLFIRVPPRMTATTCGSHHYLILDTEGRPLRLARHPAAGAPGDAPDIRPPIAYFASRRARETGILWSRFL